MRSSISPGSSVTASASSRAVSSIERRCYRPGPSAITMGVQVKTKAAILWETRAVERGGDRARPAGPGEVLVKMAASGMPLRRAPGHRRPAVRAADHRRPRGGRRGRRGRRTASVGSSRATTSCSGSSRRVAGARAARPVTRTSATSGSTLAPGCRSPTRRPATTPRARTSADVPDRYVRHHTVVNEASCIKIEADVPLDKACLLRLRHRHRLGFAVYAADVQPGDTMVVVGVGGIGERDPEGEAGRAQADRGDRPGRAGSERRRCSSAPRTPPNR